ncbi:MAG: hypothetical protein FWG02_08650 [Holophagaceae bacterium]|nr:hypothetical protein [Holophagaceae bacterium]
MTQHFRLRLFSPWDQFPFLAITALVFIYVATKGEAPTLSIVGSTQDVNYLSPDNLWSEAIVIGGFAWGFLWVFCASLSFFAREEARGVLSILEPFRGLLPTGIISVFFGLLTSITKGKIWIFVGFGLLLFFTLFAMFIALKKVPYLSPLDAGKSHVESGGKWYTGFFNVNDGDPRILVPRRNGGGLALNLFHRRAWGILITGILLIGSAVFVSFGGMF